MQKPFFGKARRHGGDDEKASGRGAFSLSLPDDMAFERSLIKGPKTSFLFLLRTSGAPGTYVHFRCHFCT